MYFLHSILKNEYLNFVPMIFTLFNILITLLFTVTLVPNIKIINRVGLIRLLTSQTDRCLIAEKHFAFQADVFRKEKEEDNISCINDNINDIQNTLEELHNFVHEFMINIIFKKLKQNEKQLDAKFNNYKNSIDNILKNITMFNDATVVALVRMSDQVIESASNVNNNIVNVIETFIISLTCIMIIIVFCQIFYNINTIILKKHTKKQLEINTEYRALNQVCHEIRNSLLPVDVTINEISQIQQLDYKYVKALKYNMKHIKYILNRRLDYNKILQNEYVLNYSRINIRDFIKSYITNFETYAEELEKKVEFNIDNIDNTDVIVDTYLLHHILTNLIRNSVKYGKDNELNNIDLIVNKEKNKIFVLIIDSGQGLLITEDNMSQPESYGLGIPFVKQIINLLPEGDISWNNRYLYSEIIGTIVKFSFKIPLNVSYNSDLKICLEQSDLMEDSSGHSSETSRKTSLECNINSPKRLDLDEQESSEWKNKLRLIIIEDSFIVSKFTIKMMSMIKEIEWESINVYINAEQFLSQYDKTKSNKYDMIMVDQNMDSTGGRMKGTDLSLKLSNDGFQGMFVIMSGNTEDVFRILSTRAKSSLKINVWSKPLPSVDNIFKNISSFYSNKKNDIL